MEWLNLLPLPVALGVVLYVNKKLEEHEKNCVMKEIVQYIRDDIKSLSEKLDRVIERLL